MSALNARVALPGVPAEEREEYLRCINQTSCESWRCLPDREISQECQDVCDNRSLRQCSVELSADPTVCGHECEGLLAMMAPPARQAWLQCTINQCGIDRRRQLRPERLPWAGADAGVHQPRHDRGAV